MKMGDLISTFLFQPPNPPTPIKLRPASSCSDTELIWIKTLKGSNIPALYLHRRYANFTILYSHGNAEDLGMLCDYLLDLSKILHVNIFAYDYTGYGYSNRSSTAEPVVTPSPIAPSEEHFYADIMAAYRYLTHDRQVSPSNIILYGRSIGSGPSCYLASRLNKKESGLSQQSSFNISRSRSYPYNTQQQRQTSYDVSSRDTYIGGLILHSPFASIYRIVMDFGFTLQSDKFPNVDRIGDVNCPVLIMHGTSDEIVPFSHGQSLYEHVPKHCKVFQPFWAQKMGHNNIEVDSTNAFVRYLMEFLQTVRQRQTTGENCRGPSRAQDEVVDLTKSFVQAHVLAMMDKGKRQHAGFVKAHGSRSLSSNSRTDVSRKSGGLTRESVSCSNQRKVTSGNVDLDDESTPKTDRGQSFALSPVQYKSKSCKPVQRRATKQSEKFREQLLIPEVRSPVGPERI